MKINILLVFAKGLHLLIDYLQLGVSIGGFALAIYLTKTNDPFIKFFRACLALGLRNHFQNVVVGTIFIYSGILSVVTGLGVYAVLKRKWRVLYCYTLIVYLLVLVEVLFFVGLFVFQNIYAKSIPTCLRKVLQEEYLGPFTSSKNDITWAFNYLQARYSCCGITGLVDYHRFEGWNRSWPKVQSSNDDQPPRAVVPYTCCKFKKEPIEGGPVGVRKLKAALVDFECPVNPHENNSFAAVGCQKKLKKHVEEWKRTLLTASFTYEAIQFVGIWAGLYVSRVLRLKAKNRKHK